MSDEDVDFSTSDASFAPHVDRLLDEDRFLASMAQFMVEGQERVEAGLLLQCELEASEDHWETGFNSEMERVLVLRFSGPRRVYEALDHADSSSAYGVFKRAAEGLKPREFGSIHIERAVALAGPVSADWRNELLAILEGRDVDNQAVGFTSVTTWQGLRFRSRSESRIAEVLDRTPGVMFLPNCRGRLGSKDRRRNLEADFIIMYGGVWGVLEVDGPHHEGKAARDHERDRPFHYHGAAVVQRYESLDCYQDPDSIVRQFMALLKAKAR